MRISDWSSDVCSSDLFGRASGESDLGPVADWHQKVIDQVVEVNETVMDHYLDLGEKGLSGDELHDAFEQCLREGHLVPVCFVSARSGRSEEHTSELQSLMRISYAVFCLKKKSTTLQEAV